MRPLVFTLCLPLALIAAPAFADDRNFFSLFNEKDGRYHMFDMQTARLHLSGSGQEIWFEANDQWSNWWQVRMAPADGHRLAPGVYPEVGCHFGRLARLELTNNNPPCVIFGDGVRGGFTIRQIAFDEQGRITSLESVFKFALGSDDAAGDIGHIRYNAYPLHLTLRSSRRSRWGARNTTFHGDSSHFWLSGNGASLQFDALVPREGWSVRIQAPHGQTLTTGHYRTAAEPTPTAAALWLGFYEQSREEHPESSCGSGARPGPGTIEIKNIRYNLDQQVDGIHATFEFRCESARRGRAEPPLTGEFRINI